MKYYIKEWPDNTASLYSETGRPLWTFSSIEDAMVGWLDKTNQELGLPVLLSEDVTLTLQ